MQKTIQTLIIACCAILAANTAHSFDIKIAVIQDKKTESSEYRLLKAYLNRKGIKPVLYSYNSYPLASKNFQNGVVNIMFTGSCIAALMIKGKIAYPVVRPIDPNGVSTYSAVIIGPAGANESDDILSLLKGKKIAACELASSGEIFVRADLLPDCQMVLTKSHSDALEKLRRHEVDYAVVKNTVWNASKKKFPQLKQIGSDARQHPNGTLIASFQADRKKIQDLKKALLDLEGDNSPEAVAFKLGTNIQGFIDTRETDFQDTFALLKKAGM